jgi:hypothetical protein
MVYDSENAPVCGYRLSIDGGNAISTDINGRFSVPNVAYGAHELTGTGAAHASFSERWDFSDNLQVFYLHIPSNARVYARVDERLTKGDLPEAVKLLGKIGDKETPTYRLYAAICAFLQATADQKKTAFQRAANANRSLHENR